MRRVRTKRRGNHRHRSDDPGRLTSVWGHRRRVPGVRPGVGKTNGTRCPDRHKRGRLIRDADPRPITTDTGTRPRKLIPSVPTFLLRDPEGDLSKQRWGVGYDPRPGKGTRTSPSCQDPRGPTSSVRGSGPWVLPPDPPVARPGFPTRGASFPVPIPIPFS